LKDSDHPAEIIVATYYYWLAKRSFQAISLALIFFSETFFEKCSGKFLNRLARFLDGFEKSGPPMNFLSEKYQKVFTQYDSKVSKAGKWCAARLRYNFIRKHLDNNKISEIVSLGHTAPVPNKI
ncbi:MAG: hypothetical protein IID17_13925, partial [Nitrospinae bacterium]|nr:hypothetical protein [Nitrospinota bacterium]